MKTVITALLSITATSFWWISVLYLSWFWAPAVIATTMLAAILAQEMYINWK